MKRTRKSNFKSRNGCVTCKSRRRKCDEIHPRCGGCERLGLECVYAKKKLYWYDTNQIRCSTALASGASKFMMVFTVRDMKLNMYLTGSGTDASPDSFKIPTKSIHEDGDFQSIINNDVDVETDLFQYYVTVISGKKVFSDGVLNEFRSVVIPNCIISPALFQTIIALSASDLNRRQNATRDDCYYSKLTSKYKNEAISTMYNLLDNPSPESLNEIGICILMLCTLEIGENGNNNWINYLKQGCMIFQSVEDGIILESKPLLFCYRYFTFRYVLLLSTLTKQEYHSITTSFPMKMIPSFFTSTTIDYMFGCSPQLLRIIGDITFYRNNDSNTDDIMRIYDELVDLVQDAHGFEKDERLIQCSTLYHLTTRLYFQNSFGGVRHDNQRLDFNSCKLIAQSIPILDSIASDAGFTLFPTWPLFMISVSDVKEIHDVRRIKILEVMESLEQIWPESSLTIVKTAIELIWKNYDLSERVDWREVLNVIGFKVCLT